MDVFEMTSTNLFIRPLFKIPMKILNSFNFENAYIQDEIKGINYPHSIYMLFRPRDPEKFNDFVEEERKRGFLIDEYDYSDGWTMLVYRYDEKWKDDIELIKIGKFSEVSREYRDEIPNTAGEKEHTIMSIQYHVFLRTDYIKGMWKEKWGIDFGRHDEVWHHYIEREIFSEETFKKIKNANK